MFLFSSIIFLIKIIMETNMTNTNKDNTKNINEGRTIDDLSVYTHHNNKNDNIQKQRPSNYKPEQKEKK